MATNIAAQVARFNEVAAVSSATEVTRLLHSMVVQPTGKLYVKQREARIERWDQLASIAQRQIEALKGSAYREATAKRKPKVTVAEAPAAATTAS